MTDDTGLSSDGAQTVSDDCTSFPRAPPFIISTGRERPHKGGPSCPLAALTRHLLAETAAPPLLFHLAVAPSISIYTMIFLASFLLAPPVPPPSLLVPHPSYHHPPLSVTHSAEGIQRSDNEIMTHPFQPFKSGPFTFLHPARLFHS